MPREVNGFTQATEPGSSENRDYENLTKLLVVPIPCWPHKASYCKEQKRTLQVLQKFNLSRDIWDLYSDQTAHI